MTFHPHIYRIFNQDVKNLPLYQLKSHWFTIGINENRISSIETFMQKYPKFNLIDFRKSHPEMNHSDIADCLYKYYTENIDNQTIAFEESLEVVFENNLEDSLTEDLPIDSKEFKEEEESSDNERHERSDNKRSDNERSNNEICEIPERPERPEKPEKPEKSNNINNYIKKWIITYNDKNVLGICLDPNKSYLFQETIIVETLKYFEDLDDLVIYFFYINQNSLDEMEKKLFPIIKKNIKYNIINNFFDNDFTKNITYEETNLFMLLCDYLLIDPTSMEHVDWNDSNAKQIFLHKTCLSPTNECMFINKNITLLEGSSEINISNKIGEKKVLEDKKKVLVIQKISSIDESNKYNNIYSIFSIINQKNVFIDILFICSDDSNKLKKIKNILSSCSEVNCVYWINDSDNESYSEIFNNSYDYFLYSDKIHFQTPYTLQKMIECFIENKVFVEVQKEIITYEEEKPKKNSSSRKTSISKNTEISRKSEKQPKKIVEIIKEKHCLENQILTFDEFSENIFLTDDKNCFIDLLNNKLLPEKINPIHYSFKNDFLIYYDLSLDEEYQEGDDNKEKEYLDKNNKNNNNEEELNEENEEKQNLLYESEFDWFNYNVELFVINLRSRKDRLQSFKEECNKIGIEEEDIIIYNAIRPSIEQAFNCSFMDLNQCWECKRRDIQYFIGASGCKMSHYNSLKKFLDESDKKYLMLCEDDAFFEEDTIQRIYQSIQSLDNVDEEWDILYVGTHLLHKEDAEWVNEFLLRVKHGLTTTAQIFPRRKILEIIEKIEQSKKEIDNTYSELLDRKYCVYPMSVCQKKFRSDIVHHMCDYGDYHRKFDYKLCK